MTDPDPNPTVPPGTIATLMDRQGRAVFPTDRRWDHISLGHPELTGNTADVRAAAFLDLQGTLGGDGFGDIRDFAFFPCAIPAIRALNDARLAVIVVTNQTRIGRGLFGADDFSARIAELQAQLAAVGARFDGVYCCPHTDEDGCACRKPSPELLRRARGDHGLDLAASYVVGDGGAWDMVMARAAGCHPVLVRTGLGEGSLGPYRHLWAEVTPDYVARDVLDAATWIVDHAEDRHGERTPPS